MIAKINVKNQMQEPNENDNKSMAQVGIIKFLIFI